MKNVASNSLKYTGIVTISRYSMYNKKSIELACLKNAGATPLFDFLAECLIGNFDRALQNCPSKIMLLSKETVDSTISYTSKSGYFYLVNRPTKLHEDSGICRLKYSFMIPRAQMQVEDESNLFNCIGLYPLSAALEADSADKFAAIVEIPAPDLDKIKKEMVNSAAQALLVDWELIISNNTDSTEGTL